MVLLFYNFHHLPL
jgi:hypothetical protein